MNETRNITNGLQIPPPNYLVWAILSTIFCCLPFGIVSIIFAAQVNSKWLEGDVTGANTASRNARLWAWVSFGVGLASVLIWVILMVFGIAGAIFLDALS